MMEWNVYLNDANRSEIKIWNVFSHASFRDEIRLALETCQTKADFRKTAERTAIHYFWSKCEYEVVITSWPPYINRDESLNIIRADLPKYRTTVNLETGLKISVYSQLRLNWNAFIDYCWSCKEEVKKPQKVKVRKVR